MRISGGEWCGRIIKVPPGNAVRPTQDRVREALFSMLMNEIADCVFVDLFGGAGSVGLDAASRGAARVTWVEKDARHAAILRANVESLMPGCGEVVCSDVTRWLRGAGVGRQADIVFADPPYIVGKEQGFEELMTLAANNNVLRPGGLFIAEMPFSARAVAVAKYELVRDRAYGKTRLAVYVRTRVNEPEEK